jgi:cell division FtsZ-interacting protein ZapD
MQDDLREKLEKLEEQATRLRVWFGVAGFDYSAIERIMNGNMIDSDNMTPLELSLQAKLDAANETIAKLRERDTVRPEG